MSRAFLALALAALFLSPAQGRRVGKSSTHASPDQSLTAPEVCKIQERVTDGRKGPRVSVSVDVGSDEKPECRRGDCNLFSSSGTALLKKFITASALGSGKHFGLCRCNKITPDGSVEKLIEFEWGKAPCDVKTCFGHWSKLVYSNNVVGRTITEADYDSFSINNWDVKCEVGDASTDHLKSVETMMKEASPGRREVIRQAANLIGIKRVEEPEEEEEETAIDAKVGLEQMIEQMIEPELKIEIKENLKEEEVPIEIIQNVMVELNTRDYEDDPTIVIDDNTREKVVKDAKTVVNVVGVALTKKLEISMMTDDANMQLRPGDKILAVGTSEDNLVEVKSLKDLKEDLKKEDFGDDMDEGGDIQEVKSIKSKNMVLQVQRVAIASKEASDPLKTSAELKAVLARAIKALVRIEEMITFLYAQLDSLKQKLKFEEDAEGLVKAAWAAADKVSPVDFDLDTIEVNVRWLHMRTRELPVALGDVADQTFPKAYGEVNTIFGKEIMRLGSDESAKDKLVENVIKNILEALKEAFDNLDKARADAWDFDFKDLLLKDSQTKDPTDVGAMSMALQVIKEAVHKTSNALQEVVHKTSNALQ